MLPKLRVLDQVAYVRFASIYRDFRDLDGFAKELDLLRNEDTGPHRRPGDTEEQRTAGDTAGASGKPGKKGKAADFMLACFTRRSFRTRCVRCASQSSYWRVAFTRFMARTIVRQAAGSQRLDVDIQRLSLGGENHRA